MHPLRDQFFYNPLSVLDGLIESFTPYAIIMTDEENKIVLWNRGAQALFKFRAKEVMGKNLMVFHDTDAPDNISFNTVVNTKFGDSIPVNITTSACQSSDGLFKGRLHILRNITSDTLRDNLLEALARCSDFFNTEQALSDVLKHIVDHIQGATHLPFVYICLSRDKSNFFVSAHSGLDKKQIELNCHISGTNAVCMSNGCKNACETNSLTMESLKLHHINQFIDYSGLEELFIHHLPLKADGYLAGVLHLVIPESLKTFYKQQQPLLKHLSTLVASIINIKTVEDGLKDYTDVLEAMVEQRTREIRQKDAFIVQSGKLAALGEMASGIAHEINQPLGGISLIAQGLKKAYDKGLLTEALINERLEAIHKQIERISLIINHLRDFSRQAAPYSTLVDIHDPIHDAFLLLGHQLKQHHIQIVLNLTEAPLKVLAERNKLEQVFLNLITNARDALDEQEHHVKELMNLTNPPEWAKSWEKCLEITTRLQEGQVIATFKDTAGGIRKPILERIFEPFFTTKEVGKGTGLGLAISYGIIKGFSGEIKVETVVDSGSIFTVILPAAKEE